MPSGTSKSAYLSKYLDNGDNSDDDSYPKKKRKKDKKKDKKKKKTVAVLAVHDESDDSILGKNNANNNSDEDSEDDGPLVVNAHEQADDDAARKEAIRQQQRGTWEDEPIGDTANDSRRKRYDSDSGDSEKKDRRRHDSSDEEEAAPSSKRQRHDSDSDNDTGSDGSNKKRTRYDSDDSDDSANRKTSTARKRYDSDSDKSSDSGGRNDKGRKRYDSDNSYDNGKRRTRHDSDASSDSDPKQKSKRRRHDSGSSDNNSGNDSVDSQGRPTKLSSGHKAGLQQGRQFSQAEAKIQAQRKKVVEKMVEEHGHGETVFRNPDGTISDVKELSAEEVALKQKQQRYLLNQGSAQLAKNKAMYEERQQLSQASFARRREDVDEDFKHIERSGDPMAKYNTKNSNQKGATSGSAVAGKPIYKGPPAPPNRYGIKPGYRWDGQHRGNNFERQLLAKQFAKQHHKEQAYKYSSADM